MALGEKTSQQQLQQQLDEGEVLEIAGYPLTADFVQSVRQMADVHQLDREPSTEHCQKKPAYYGLKRPPCRT